MRPFPWFLLTALVLGLAAVGCDDGGGSHSGINRSKYLDEMSADEIVQFCAWEASLVEPGEHACPSGITMTTYTASECVERSKDRPAPHCLISLAEDCLSSAKGDPCQVLVTDVCKTYVACAAQKSTDTTAN